MCRLNLSTPVRARTPPEGRPEEVQLQIVGQCHRPETDLTEACKLDGYISQGHQHPATNNVPRTHPVRIGPEPSDGATFSDFLTGDSESPDEWRLLLNEAVQHCQRKPVWLLEEACHRYELLQRLVPFESGRVGHNEGRLYKPLGDLEREGLTRHLLVRQKGLPH
jgi:hypothetical protein